MYTCLHAYMYTLIHVYMYACVHVYMHTGNLANRNANIFLLMATMTRFIPFRFKSFQFGRAGMPADYNSEVFPLIVSRLTRFFIFVVLKYCKNVVGDFALHDARFDSGHSGNRRVGVAGPGLRMRGQC